VKGLIDSFNFYNVIIAGDFNVYLYSSCHRNQLMSFMSDLNLCSVDLFMLRSSTHMSGMMVQLHPGQITSSHC